MLARVERFLAFVLVGVATLCKERLPWSAFVVFAIVVLQAMWLSPALGARTDAISLGLAVMPSRLHDAFVALEIIKCGALGHIGWRLSGERRARDARPNALPRELDANPASPPAPVIVSGADERCNRTWPQPRDVLASLADECRLSSLGR